MARALERLVEQRRQLADLDLGVGRDAAHAPAEPRERPQRERKRHEGDQRQHPILIKHEGDEADRGHRFLAQPGQDGGRGAAQHVGVVGEARDQRAGRVGMEKGEIGAHQPGEQRELDIGDDALADRRHQHRLAVAGEALGEGQRDDRRRDDIEQRPSCATKTRSSIGCISQALAAVVPATTAMQPNAATSPGQWPRTWSCTSRRRSTLVVWSPEFTWVVTWVPANAPHPNRTSCRHYPGLARTSPSCAPRHFGSLAEMARALPVL